MERIEDLLETRIDNTSLSLFNLCIDELSLEVNEDDSYYKCEQKGICLICNSHNIVTTIQMYSDGYQNYQGYLGELPLGGNIRFSDSRDSAIKKLGIPIKTGGMKKLPILGYIARWDKFLCEELYIHLRYSMDDSCINLVSISRREMG